MKCTNSLSLEFKKIKVLNILTVVLLVPFLANVFGLINYLGNREVLTHQWQSLWTQVSLFYFSFFLIPLIAIIVATLWSVEHKAGLKFIRMSPVNNRSFILSKICMAGIILTLTQGYFLLLFYLGGRFVCHFAPIPFSSYILNILLSLGFSMPIIFLFTALAIRIQSLGGLVLLSGLTSLGGFLLAAQNIVPLASKVFGLSSISLALNNQRPIATSDFILYSLCAILEVVCFFWLANKFLKYEK